MKRGLYLYILLILGTAILICALLCPAAHGPLRLRITRASQLEKTLAVKAAGDTLRFYTSAGFQPPDPPRLTFLFQHTIHIGDRELNYAHGLYESASRTIRVVHYASPQFQLCTFLGHPACPELYYSLLVHECAHFLNGLIAPDIGVTLDEWLACTVQLTLLPEDVRAEVLKGGPQGLFKTTRDINVGAYIADPDRFVISSYLFEQKHPYLIHRVLSKQVPPIKDPLLIE